MVGQGKHQYEDEDRSSRYHGKRRNATTNIGRNYNADNPTTSDRVGRVSQNPIYSRLSNNVRGQPQGGGGGRKQDHTWKSNKGYKQGGDKQQKYREVYSAMHAVDRLKIGDLKKTYKIGDTNDSEVKPLLASQPFCKISTMTQEVFDLVVQFMQQFFTCLDKNRDELLAAYHPNALFSISFNLKSMAASSRRASRFGNYVRESRNLLFVQNEDRAYSLLHRNNIDIVAYLKKLPTTDHIASSFKLDSAFFQPHLLTFSISGVYKELGEASSLRAFTRTFVCVPVSSEQMSIVNEQCIISNVSDQQQKTYSDEIRKLRDESSTESRRVVSTSEGRPPPLMSASSKVDEKQKMIQRFSTMSNLNLNWSKDCLEFSDWNFEAAEKNFFEHRNDIPATAFQNHLMN